MPSIDQAKFVAIMGVLGGGGPQGGGFMPQLDPVPTSPFPVHIINRDLQYLADITKIGLFGGFAHKKLMDCSVSAGFFKIEFRGLKDIQGKEKEGGEEGGPNLTK